MAKKQDDVVLHRVPNPKNKKINTNKDNNTKKEKSNKNIKSKVDTSKFDKQFIKNIKVLSILIIIISFFILLSLISYSPSDEAFLDIKTKDLIGLLKDNESVISKTEATSNWLGLIGAFISNYLYNYTFGYAALIFPVILLSWGYNLYKYQRINDRVLKYTMLSLILALVFAGFMGNINKLAWIDNLPKEFYGIVGNYISNVLYSIIGGLGAIFIYLSIIFLTIYYGFGYKFNQAKLLINKASEVDTSEFKSKVSSLSLPYKKLRDYFNKESLYDENEVVSNDSKETRFKNIDYINQGKDLTIQYEKAEKNYDENAKLTKDDHSDNIYRSSNKELNPLINNYNNTNNNDNIAAKIVRQNIDFNRKDLDEESLIDDDYNTSAFIGHRNNRIQNSDTKEILDQIDLTENENKDDNYFQNDNSSSIENDLMKNVPAFEEIQIENSENEEILNSDLANDSNDLIINNSENDFKINRNIDNENNNDNDLLNSNLHSKSLHIYVQDPIEIEEVKKIPTSPISVAVLDEKINYKPPTINLLESSDESLQINDDELKMNAQILQEKLETFNITIENLEITPGPVVTQYEFVPAQGIKISKIENLSDDIAMALKARGIRIIAPIPGKGTVGLEIPNLKPIMVKFSSLLKSAKFYENKFSLPIALGKTINGEVYIADLAKMPHLLIAGATGSGKSVGINTILASLLYKLHPRDIKFVIIDPKKVELRQYESLENHFLAVSPDLNDPIITEPTDAVVILKALVAEMENRYDILAEVKERNISDYNKKISEGKIRENSKYLHRRMPYIVCIIDELADLMLTAKKEIENPIVRLTQLARAVGIHLIVATQRPSVDVITGLIKSNIPARASYLVASKIDSRTILDMVGADQLLGNGDMLFLPAGSAKPERIQNAFISSGEVEAICEFIGSQEGYSEPYCLPSIAEEFVEANDIDINDRDVLFADAAKVIVEKQTASISFLQRRLNIGYARAGRIIDQLEAAGVVGPNEGSKSRNVYIESMSDLHSVI